MSRESTNTDATNIIKLRDIITSSWHSDRSARPTMPQIVYTLECIQEELLSVFAQAQSDDFERSGTGRHGLPMEKCFTGAFLIENWESLAHVARACGLVVHSWMPGSCIIFIMVNDLETTTPCISWIVATPNSLNRWLC